MKSDYLILAGKCHEACLALQQVIPELELVRGYYISIGNYSPHWWLRTPEGTIIDPTRAQFDSGGIYEEFNGSVECEQCGKEIAEEDIIPMGSYPVCSNTCARKLVGV